MNRMACGVALLLLTLALPRAVSGQAPGDIRELKLRDWQPRSMLNTRATAVSKARFPVIDVHNHLGGGKGVLDPRAGRTVPRRDGRDRHPDGGEPGRRLGRAAQGDAGRAR